jgi:anionic cell wall polymer biosynthesis LytR-Cps2A-Psr (LCP) family protein
MVTVDVTATANPSATLPIPTAVPLQPIADDAVTIVLLGSDQRPDWDDWHTDLVQYVVIHPSTPAVAILSIPRDLYVYIPDFWMSRINFADMYGEMNDYEGGGLGLLNQAMLYNLGISADYYIKVEFDGLIGLVDAMGGIDVPVHCLLEDYWPYPN